MIRIERRRRSRRFQIDWLEPRTLLAVVPNDPGFSSQWGLDNSNNVDIDAPEAWGITTGSPSVLMAVIDSTGVLFSHVDLDGKISPLSPTPSSTNDHATIIAGIMGAESNNGQGIAGISWGSPILALQSGTTTAFANAVDFAISKGVKVISISSSFPGDYFEVRSAIDRAGNAGIVVVAAAGNDGTSTPVYPARYSRNFLIGVASVDSSGALASNSNYSSTLVQLAAPGVNISSTQGQRQLCC